MTCLNEGKTKIIIVGAGFAGLRCARNLAGNSREVILIDRNNCHAFTPLFYDLESKNSKLPIKTEAKFMRRDVSDFSQLDYDYLVLAVGAEINYCNIPGLEENALTFKTVKDVEKLEVIPSGDIVIIGGGPTGCGLAAELACRLEDERITLIEAGASIMPNLGSWMQKKTRKRLEKLGIKIRTNSCVEKVEKKRLHLASGSHIFYDNLIWAGGVRMGKYQVDQYLRVKDNIFAIGDCADAFPGLINPSLRQAELAAENIIRDIEGRSLKKYHKRSPGFIIELGGRYALAEIYGIKFSGILPWTLKKIIKWHYKATY